MNESPLHTLGRQRPDRPFQVEFLPPCATGFQRPCGRQDDELQASGRDTLAAGQFVQEGWHLLPRHGGPVFLSPPHDGQRLLQPVYRVLVRVVPRALGPVEHSAQALLEAARKFVLLRPDWSKDAVKVGRGDALEGTVAKAGLGVGAKHLEPGGRMLGVLPRRTELSVNRLGCLPEGQACLTAERLGVTALARHAAQGASPLPGFGKGDERGTPQAQLAAASVHDGPQDPRLRPGAADAEIEALAVAVHAGLAERVDLPDAELGQSYPSIYPTSHHGIGCDGMEESATPTRQGAQRKREFARLTKTACNGSSNPSSPTIPPLVVDHAGPA